MKGEKMEGTNIFLIGKFVLMLTFFSATIGTLSLTYFITERIMNKRWSMMAVAWTFVWFLFSILRFFYPESSKDIDKILVFWVMFLGITISQCLLEELYRFRLIAKPVLCLSPLLF